MRLENRGQVEQAQEVIRFAVERVDDVDGVSEKESIALHVAHEAVNVSGFDAEGIDLEDEELLGLRVAAAIGLGENIDVEGPIYKYSASIIIATSKWEISSEGGRHGENAPMNPWTIPGP